MQDFFRGLFDFNFETLVTPAIVRPLYILWVVLAGLGGLFMFVTSLMAGATGIVIALIIVPIFFIVQVIFARMYAELAFVIFDVNDRLESLGGRRGGETPLA